MTLAQPWFTAAAAAAASGIPVLAPATRADARPAASPAVGPAASRACPPAGVAVSFSDSLDKLVYHGVELGGLSSLAWDPRSADWVSAVDNHGTDPARIWFFRNLAHPTVIRDPLVLRKPDGTAYDGTNSDNEGLAVLPDGDYLVSSETEPSIRIYGRDGVQKASLPVPARFAVTGTTPEGQATSNATLEGSRSRVPAARSSRPWRAPCPATFRPAALAAWLRQSCRMAPVRAVPLRRKGSLRSCVLRGASKLTGNARFRARATPSCRCRAAAARQSSLMSRFLAEPLAK